MISFDESISEADLLSMAASAEAKSEHPLGKAIVALCKGKKSAIDGINCFQNDDRQGDFCGGRQSKIVLRQ